MRISELSERSGLPVQTIKFYIREGLLPKGTPCAATRAEYDQAHLERLRLIRALREVGDLPVAAIRRIVEALEDEQVSLHDLFGRTQYALGPHASTAGHDPDLQQARDDVDAFLTELGWQVTEQAPARELLAQTLVALRRLGFATGPDELRPYARAAAALAEHETGRLAEDTPRAQAVRGMLVTTVLYEQVLIALHRLAQEDASARRFSGR
ncbi:MULTISPECIES: MerR family transcriptional regulator [Thermomonospora]|uniref:Transcriptional regulator, MerR family n=1 Tax=Thermomonospora curvata (strain ATCC 19995 / DSM 43183 / JCM 3096 / KCTC 9072 / NBRC 15933 / NCIMB 10081 / Henssen B9) TaxID=471852 RepID=D1AB61_THECD|nr:MULTISPECIES: MerR family transcriptional regulator [Thermomonospora]ACY99004.1 transcriptional regulator, MerR family [Thermomonospora curvata DSM 43183]PKK13193.1 MAG: MerR family transcriptional regulator [Thermomonospora sp. CIF 1]